MSCPIPFTTITTHTSSLPHDHLTPTCKTLHRESSCLHTIHISNHIFPCHTYYTHTSPIHIYYPSLII